MARNDPETTGATDLTRRRLLQQAGAAAALVPLGGLLLPASALGAEAPKLKPGLGKPGFEPVTALGPKVNDNGYKNGRFRGWGSRTSRRIVSGGGGGTVFFGDWYGVPHRLKGQTVDQYATAGPLASDSCLKLQIRNPGVFYVRQYISRHLEDVAGKDYTISTDIELKNLDAYAGKTGARQIKLAWYVNYKYRAGLSTAEQCREPIINTTGNAYQPLDEGRRAFFHNRFRAPSPVPNHPTWKRDRLEGFEAALVVLVPPQISLADINIRQMRFSRNDDFKAVHTGA